MHSAAADCVRLHLSSAPLAVKSGKLIRRRPPFFRAMRRLGEESALFTFKLRRGGGIRGKKVAAGGFFNRVPFLETIRAALGRFPSSRRADSG